MAAFLRFSVGTGSSGSLAQSGRPVPQSLALRSALLTLRRLLGCSQPLATPSTLAALLQELRAGGDGRGSVVEGVCFTLIGARSHPATVLAAAFSVIRRRTGMAATAAAATAQTSFYTLPLCSSALWEQATSDDAGAASAPAAAPVAEPLPPREDRWRGLAELLCTTPRVFKVCHDVKATLYALLRCPATRRFPFQEANLWDPTIAAWLLVPDWATASCGGLQTGHLMRGAAGAAGAGGAGAGGTGAAAASFPVAAPAAEAAGADKDSMTLQAIAACFRVPLPELAGGSQAAYAPGSMAAAGHPMVAQSAAQQQPAHPVLAHLQLLAATANVLASHLSQQGLLSAFLSQEMRVVVALAAMEVRGMGFDPAPLRASEAAVKARLEAVQREAYRLAGRPFLVSSSKQVAEVLYDYLKLSPPGRAEHHTKNARKGEKRHESADERALVQLAAHHPLPGLLLEHRKLFKVLTSFMTPLPEAAARTRSSGEEGGCGGVGSSGSAGGGDVDGETRAGVSSSVPVGGSRCGAASVSAAAFRIHGQLQQVRTGTGRLSSMNPNLQNLPRYEAGAEADAGGGGASSDGGNSGCAEPEQRYANLIRDSFVASPAPFMLLRQPSANGATDPFGMSSWTPPPWAGGVGTYGSTSSFGATASGFPATAGGNPFTGVSGRAQSAQVPVAVPVGRILVSIDYSQIEMRVLAHLANDANLLKMFAAVPESGAGAGASHLTVAGSGGAHAGSSSYGSSGATAMSGAAGDARQSVSTGPSAASHAPGSAAQAGDVYMRMASQVFKVPLPSVTPAMRSQAKTAVLGLVYGIGPAEMAGKLGIPEEEAVRIRGAFLATYPGIRAFMANARAFAARHGYVVTLSGRKRWLPDIASPVSAKKQYAERQAVNSIVQGSAADLMKAALYAVDAWLRCERDVGAPAGSTSGPAAATSTSSAVAASTSGASVATATDPAVMPAAPARLLLQIHDELLLEAADDPASLQALVSTAQRHLSVTAPRLVAEIAESAQASLVHRARSGTDHAAREALSSVLGGSCLLRVPLPVNVKVGRTWGSLRPY
jgi:DNA polymerase I-like protein with 3'-5' exonuclease and polymerase domains